LLLLVVVVVVALDIRVVKADLEGNRPTTCGRMRLAVNFSIGM